MLQILGSLFIIMTGSLLHFLYEWSNNNKLVGFFASVNESTWEHIKLAITPAFLWLVVERHFYFSNPNLFFAKFISMLVMIIIIPVAFYTYKFFTRKKLFSNGYCDICYCSYNRAISVLFIVELLYCE